MSKVKIKKSDKQAYNTLFNYLQNVTSPDSCIKLDSMLYLKQTKGCYIEYTLNKIKAREYIHTTTITKLLEYLGYIKERRENLIGGKCVLNIQKMEAMTFYEYCNKEC